MSGFGTAAPASRERSDQESSIWGTLARHSSILKPGLEPGWHLSSPSQAHSLLMGTPGALHYQEPRWKLLGSDPLGTTIGEHAWHLFPIPSCDALPGSHQSPQRQQVPWCKQLPLGVQTHSASATTGFPGDTITESRATFKWMCKCVCPLRWEAIAAATPQNMSIFLLLLSSVFVIPHVLIFN